MLVILGLLTGGILAGRSLVRASEIRSVGNDYTKYRTATFAFKDKYFGLPGDIANATAFWRAQDGDDGLGTDCTDIASTTALTCNGNGNAMLESYERYRFWQQLANAGLLEGSYAGVGDNPASQNGGTPGYNVPVTRLDPAVFTALWRTSYNSGSADVYPMGSTNIFHFGKKSSPSSTATASRPVLRTEEAWNIDSKFDDGKPALGKIRTFKHGATASWAAGSANCADNTNSELAEYSLALGDIQCALMLIW